jgi:DNA damage-binding protein 1
MLYYAATALKGDSVSNSFYAHVLSPNEKTLVIVKPCKLQFYKIDCSTTLPMDSDHPTTLANDASLITEFHLNGRVSLITPHRHESSLLDHLIILTEKYQLSEILFDPESGHWTTIVHGEVADKTGRPCNSGSLLLKDPGNRCLGLHLYQGLLKIIPMYQTSMRHDFTTFEVGMAKNSLDGFPSSSNTTSSSTLRKGKGTLKGFDVGQLGEPVNLR